MENSKVISDFVRMSKRDKRLANKKRKAEALINLLGRTDEVPHKKVKMAVCEIQDGSSPNKVPEGSSPSDSEGKTMSRKHQLHQLKKQRMKEKRKLSKPAKKDTAEWPALYLTLKELLEQQRNKRVHLKSDEELPPLFMLDLQHLLTFALLPDSYKYYPRWCKLARPRKVASVVVIVIDQLSSNDLEEHQECFPFMKKTFDLFTEMISPYQYGGSVMEDVFHVPVSKRSINSKAMNDEEGRIMLKNQIDGVHKTQLQLQQSLGITVPDTSKHVPAPDFNRTHLLLNPMQMMQEGYPMPVNTLRDRYKDFKFSFKSYKSVTHKSPLFSIDCEMCLTTAQENELTRVSVINEKLETVYDTLVKPFNRITNYLTQYSGITKKMLVTVKTRLKDVQKHLRKLLPSDSIWVGQSLNGDLAALKLFHPYVIDTSVIYNMSGMKWKKTGLKALAAHFLKQDIQLGSSGHCSVEDACAAMELVQLKLQKGMDFGDATRSVIDPAPSANGASDEVTGEVETATQVMDKRRLFFQQNKSCYRNFLTMIMDEKKTATVIDKPDTLSTHLSDVAVCCSAETSDKARTATAAQAVQKQDFVWVQLHALNHRKKIETANAGEEKSVAESGEEEERAASVGKSEIGDSDKEKMEEGEKKSMDLIKRYMKRIDKRVKRIAKNVQPKSLLCVVLSGQPSKKAIHNAGVLLNIM
ncbi:RNA exonuclease 5-like [Haliotis asinina]|uniref:RNA exonuclease 5-like n=1 Tax=Haliotis asinina TaxID=109174 RepID=UPI003531A843